MSTVYSSFVFLHSNIILSKFNSRQPLLLCNFQSEFITGRIVKKCQGMDWRVNSAPSIRKFRQNLITLLIDKDICDRISSVGAL